MLDPRLLYRRVLYLKYVRSFPVGLRRFPEVMLCCAVQGSSAQLWLEPPTRTICSFLPCVLVASAGCQESCSIIHPCHLEMVCGRKNARTNWQHVAMRYYDTTFLGMPRALQVVQEPFRIPQRDQNIKRNICFTMIVLKYDQYLMMMTQTIVTMRMISDDLQHKPRKVG